MIFVRGFTSFMVKEVWEVVNAKSCRDVLMGLITKKDVGRKGLEIEDGSGGFVGSSNIGSREIGSTDVFSAGSNSGKEGRVTSNKIKIPAVEGTGKSKLQTVGINLHIGDFVTNDVVQCLFELLRGANGDEVTIFLGDRDKNTLFDEAFNVGAITCCVRAGVSDV